MTTSTLHLQIPPRAHPAWLILGWSLVAAVIFGFASLGYVVYLATHEVRTLEVKNFSYTSPIPVMTPILHPGDVLKYTFDYCKFFDGVPTSERQLVDGQIIPLTNEVKNATLPMGCHTTERDVVIPETVNPGKYYLNVKLHYQVNALRSEEVDYYTDYFQVVPRSYASTSKPPSTSQISTLPDPTALP